jgi:CBS-domain-containing membrane protein
MITDRDVAVAAYTQGKPLSQIQVQTAMSQALHTTHVSDTLLAAEQLMRAEQLHRLPVVDESTRLVGILSLNDIARLRSQSAPTRNADASHDLAATVAAISQRRRPSSAPPEAARVDQPAEEERRRPPQPDIVRPQTSRPSGPRIAASSRAGR